MTGAATAVSAVATTDQLSALQRECAKGYIDPSLIQYAVRLASATRNPERFGIKDLSRYLSYGASPRASIHLIEGARALAFLRGRDYVLPEDVTDMAPDVLRHRLVLAYEALAEGLTPDEIVHRVMQHIRAPEKPLATHVRVAAQNPEAILRRLEWTVIRRLDGLLHGDYRTLFRGFGVDLADLREYQYHDDVRHIDWNVTARLQTPYVREYHEDREVTAWLLLDLSPSVDFGSQQVKKRAVSMEFVTVLARLLTRHGNRVGALFYGDKLDTVIPAKSGRRHVLHILHSILARPARTQSAATNLEDFLRGALQVMKRRSLVFVVSDFISEPGWAEPLCLLARRHEVIAVRLYDPLEMELPDLGLLVMQDAETGEQLFVDTHDRGFRKRFAAAAERREKMCARRCGKRASMRSSSRPHDDLVDAILRFADLRKRRSRVATGAMPQHLVTNV